MTASIDLDNKKTIIRLLIFVSMEFYPWLCSGPLLCHEHITPSTVRGCPEFTFVVIKLAVCGFDALFSSISTRIMKVVIRLFHEFV